MTLSGATGAGVTEILRALRPMCWSARAGASPRRSAGA